jgi:hypothetical protein
MKLILLVPNVVKNFIAQFPETTRNGYGYFNYDNRVIQERVPRGDVTSPYMNPDDFSNADYQELVKSANGMINPILAKYDQKTACEDALNMAIKSFANGLFDSKINANKFAVLLSSMMSMPVQAASKTKTKSKPESKPLVLPHKVLKNLGISKKDVGISRIKAPRMVREKGKVVIK